MDIPQPEDYQIGWIYALQLELTAAKVFFDKEYPQPQDAAQNDNNNYVLGRMGKHHIVVAGLPLGQTGNNSAATVLKDMVRSYPNLRFVLMVGIGGGVPNAKNNLREECENEIHLGDVVVSAPSGQHGAVIQYDFGKEHQDRGFEFTGYQNLPSATLLGAIPTLQSNHDIDGTDSLANRIEARLNLKPKLRKTYGRPENKTDKLYSSDFVHVDGNATCNECDETKIIRRGREDEDKVPRVHYGLIASGNKVMRDAKQRDFLAKEKGVLCFEMEAGGLMNSWSCLVVRGICDYSDSHKHKKWQQYSALSAASYARELLDLIPQQRIGGDQKIADQISKDVEEIKLEVTNIGEMIQKERLDKWLSRLSNIDYAAKQKEHIDSCEEDTGTWFLESTEFTTWKESPGKVLFCPGVPGAGKSGIASIVIEHLTRLFQKDGNPKAKVGYFYHSYDYKEQPASTSTSVLSTIFNQLCNRGNLPQIVRELLHAYENNHNLPTSRVMLTALEAVVRHNDCENFIIIDGLDESYSRAEDSLPTMKSIMGLRTCGRVNILVTSRPNNYIEGFIRTQVPMVDLLTLSIEASISDLTIYLNKRLNDHVLQDCKQACLKRIVKMSAGIFLIARILCKIVNSMMSPESIADNLAKLTRSQMTPTDVYKRSMDRIMDLKGEQKLNTLKTLQWIVHAERRLTKLELEHALAIRADSREFSAKDIVRLDDILPHCAGLVRLNRHSHRVELIHSTAKTFLSTHEEIRNQNALALICLSCVTYLSYRCFDSGPCTNVAALEERKADNPMFMYASSYWGEHASNWTRGCRTGNHLHPSDGSLKEINRAILRFLTAKKNLFASVQGYISRFPIDKDIDVFEKTTALHLAARYGLDTIFGDLLDDSRYTTFADAYRYGNTPILNAARHGHGRIVQALLSRPEVNINQSDKNKRSPISLAASNVHVGAIEALRELIRSGRVNVESRDYKGRTALSFAASRSDQSALEAVELLVDQGKANIGSREADNWSPLARAAAYGHKKILDYLLSKRYNSMARHPTRRKKTSLLESAVLKAAEYGQLDCVEMVFKSSPDEVNVDFQNYRGETALWQATNNGHKSVMQYLIESRAADVKVSDNCGVSPISLAFQNFDKELIRIVLGLDMHDLHVDKRPMWDALYLVSHNDKYDHVLGKALEAMDLPANSADRDGTTPLQWAVRKGLTALVKQNLRQEDVDLDKTSNAGYTALWHAVETRNLAVVRLILERVNVNPNIRAPNPAASAGNGVPRSSLELALEHRDENMVSMLFSCGTIDMTQQDWMGRSPIFSAAERGLTTTVQLFLQSGKVDVNAKNSRGLTPLMVAVGKGHVDTVRLLLESNADVNIGSGRKATALSIGVQKNRVEIVKLLLEKASDSMTAANRTARQVMVNLRDCKGRTPLHIAVERGNHNMVTVLASSPRITTNIQDQNGRTPLHTAINANRHDMVSQLAPLSKAALSKKDKKGMTPLHLAIARKSPAVVAELLKLSLNWIEVNKKTVEGFSALSTVVRQSQWTILEIMSSVKGIDLNTKDKYGRSPLSDAIGRGEGLKFLSTVQSGLSMKSIDQLLSSGRIELNSKDKKGKTILFHAVERQDVQLVMTLLRSSTIEANRADDRGLTPLMAAVSNRCIDRNLVEALRRKTGGNSINHQCQYGRTVLSYAAEFGHEEMSRQLLKMTGAKPDLPDGSRRTPLSYACAKGQLRVVDLLLALGDDCVDANLRDHNGMSPLSHAIRNGRSQIVERLLSVKSLRLDVKGQHRRTPIEEAISCAKEDIVRLLRDAGRVCCNS